MKKSWDRLSIEEKEVAKKALILYFEKEREEKIGVIAAENILSFFLENIGGKLYNKGVKDAQKAMEYRSQELSYDLDDLMDNE